MEGGIDWMNHSISDTARVGRICVRPAGDYAQNQEEMKKDPRAKFQSGAFAKAWIAGDRAGRSNFKRMKDAYANHPIEKVGAVLRSMMPWLKRKGDGSETRSPRRSR